MIRESWYEYQRSLISTLALNLVIPAKRSAERGPSSIPEKALLDAPSLEYGVPALRARKRALGRDDKNEGKIDRSILATAGTKGREL